MRPVLVILLCAVAVGAAALVLTVAGDRDEPAQVGTPPAAAGPRTDDFVDSVGVTVHLNYLDTAYGRQPEVLDRLRELGVRHVREGFPYRAPSLSRGLRALARMGVRGTLVTDVNIPVEAGVAGGLRDMGRHVEAFEGPNEIDASGIPGWPGRLRAYLTRLRGAIRGRGSRVPVVGPAFVDLRHYAALPRRSYDLMALHPYPDGLPAEERLAERVTEARSVAPGKPIAITETGYQNALAAPPGVMPVSERAAAVYLPRLLLWSFRAGVERTFIYELLDEKPEPALRDPEQHFGLLRQDLTPKPAYLAVRNLLRAVRRSPGAADGTAPAPVVHSPEPVERLDLTRPDGSRLVALWRAVSVWDRDRRRELPSAPAAVRVRWPRAVRDLAVHRPSLGDRPSIRRASAGGLRLELAGDVVLLSYR